MTNQPGSNTTTKASDIQVGDEIAIHVGSATASSRGSLALATSMIMALVDNATDRAVRIADGGVYVWLPRCALVKGAICDVTSTKRFSLAHWFRPDAQTAKFMARMTDHSVISA